MPRTSDAARAAQFFSMSTIPSLAKAGQSELEDERRKARQFINLGRGVVYNPHTREANLPPEYAQAVKEARDAEMEGLNTLLSNRTDGRFPIEGKPPTAGQEAKARESYRLSGEAGELREQVGQNPDALGTVADPVLDWMRSSDNSGGIISQLAPAFERLMYDPKDLKLRAGLARYESDLSKLAAGLAVTGFEMADRKKWSPFAPGLNAKQVQDRLSNLQVKLKGQYFGAYGRETPSQGNARQPINVTPAPAAAPAPAPPQGQEVQHKTINGQKYLSTDGGWNWRPANGQ